MKHTFEKEVEKIIGINPSHLAAYFDRRYKLNDCSMCSKSMFIKEIGLTKENIAIIYKFIKQESVPDETYCMGSDKKESYVFCYERGLLALLTFLQREVFSYIQSIKYVLHNKSQDFKKSLSIAREGEKRLWNIIEHGILSLNKSYKRTKFEYSEDILTFHADEGPVVMLHGHQLKDFLRGNRKEQKYSSVYHDESIYLVQLGHFHRLGVYIIPNFSGIIALGGSFLFPVASGYSREMLSQLGNVRLWSRDGRIGFEVFRSALNEEDMYKTMDKNTEKPMSYAEKLESFRTFCKTFECFVPGNHDPFDVIFLKKGFPFGSVRAIGLGDYLELNSEEMSYAKKDVLRILNEEGFISICDQ